MRNHRTVDWKFIVHKYLRLHGPRTYSRIIWRLIFPGKSWEPQVWKTLHSIKGDLFVDVGAHHGVYAVGLCKNFRKVVAFEPDPSVYRLLFIEAEKKLNVEMRRQAVSNIDGKTILFLEGMSCPSILPVFEYSPASSVLKDTITYHGEGGVEVSTARLDTLFNSQIDLLKVDVEGAEFLVLEGARKLLAGGLIKRAMIELHDRKRKEKLERMFTVTYKTRWVDPDHFYAEKR